MLYKKLQKHHILVYQNNHHSPPIPYWFPIIWLFAFCQLNEMRDPWLNDMAHSPRNLISVLSTELEKSSYERWREEAQGLWWTHTHCHNSELFDFSHKQQTDFKNILTHFSSVRLVCNWTVQAMIQYIKSSQFGNCKNHFRATGPGFTRVEVHFWIVSLISLGLVTSDSTLGDQITNPHSIWQTSPSSQEIELT